MMRSLQFVVVVLCFSWLMVACSEPGEAWSEARGQDTVAAYQEFLRQYPDSEFSAGARIRIRELVEEQAWNQAAAIDSMEVYEMFLRGYPDSPQAVLASTRLTALLRQQHWTQIEASADAFVLEIFAAQYPNTPEAEHARALIERMHTGAPAAEAESATEAAEDALPPLEPVADDATHRVQLAAIGLSHGEAQAQASRTQLENALQNVLDGVRLEVRQNEMNYLLQTSPLTRAGASELCAALQTSGQDCFIVAR